MSEVNINYKGSTIATMDASGTKTLQTSGKYCEGNVEVVYTRPSAPTPTYQTKSIAPTENAQTVTPDGGYDALSQVNVGAISSTYVGSGITRRSSSSLTASGTTVTAPAGYYASQAQITVSGGESKNTQVVQGTTRTTSSSLTAIGAEMTVSKTGTYDVYWSAFRSSTSSSYTYATQLYVGGTAYGTQNTTWSNHVQDNHLTNVSLTENQKIRVYGRNSRGSSYYIYAPTLVIVEA